MFFQPIFGYKKASFIAIKKLQYICMHFSHKNWPIARAARGTVQPVAQKSVAYCKAQKSLRREKCI